MIKRRHFLLSGLMASTACLTLYRLPALASTQNSQRFVWVILRGAMDGLNTLIPYADSHYSKLRGSIALAKPGGAESAIKLTADFALHPSLQQFAQWYQRGELIAFPAVTSPYRERSHFDGQNVLENGGVLPYQQKDGWLNRALAAALVNDPTLHAVAIGSSIPLTLQGSIGVQSWSPSVLPEANGDLYSRLSDLYSGDERLATQLNQLQKTRSEVASMDMASGGRINGLQSFKQMAEAAGKLLSAVDGPQVATLELGGWDTHANQGAETGRLANQLAGLDNGLATLRTELGTLWNQTTVVVMTEFGRTAKVNGTGGTDHGTASAAFLLGGTINGGRILGDWPGLSTNELFEGRDLRGTVDGRSILKSILGKQLQLSEAVLAEQVFPGSNAVLPFDSLFKS